MLRRWCICGGGVVWCICGSVVFVGSCGCREIGSLAVVMVSLDCGDIGVEVGCGVRYGSSQVVGFVVCCV